MSIRRLTQEDPIGIKGGLNLYGFAASDPVNYSDPFGLCPECEDQNPYSIVVRGRELNPNGFVVSNPAVRRNVARLYENIRDEVGSDDFTFQVTGGDRFVDAGEAGRHRSMTDMSVVEESGGASGGKSPHLDTQGARAVDLRIRGASDEVVDRAIKKTDFLPQNTRRGYADGHTHVALPNRRKYYEQEQRREP